MYTLNGWWFLSSGGAYPPVFTVGSLPAITATSYYKIVGVAVLAFRLSLLLPSI